MSQTPHPEQPVWTRWVILAVFLAYVTGFMVMAVAAGPWQAVRDFAAEGLILFLWLLAAHWLLKGQPVIQVPVRRPLLELSVGLVTVVVLFAGASLYYLGQPLFRYFDLAVIYALTLIVLIRQDEPKLALGLRWPSKRVWLVLLVIVVINVLVGVILGNILPEGELPIPPGSDLADELTSLQQVLLAIGRLAVVAAIPEELFFRVYLQPRLSRFVPVGWAILIQAVLFSAVHLPQGLIRYGESWPVALAGVFTMANGVIGGCLWYRTRSLPLLVILHLLAYIRIGL